MFLFLFLNVYTWQIWLGRKKLDRKTFESKIKQLEQNFVQIFNFFTSWCSWIKGADQSLFMGT